jgi:hypothetical protein
MTAISFVFFLIVRLGLPLVLLIALGTMIEKRSELGR